MADPPPIRRSTTLAPPPIPRLPVAPASAKTDVVPVRAAPGGPHVHDDLPDDTRNLEAPDADELVDHRLALVQGEADALRGEPGTQPDHAEADARRADLDLRLALAAWDARGDRDEALRVLEQAALHPLAPRLRLAVAIAAGGAEALAAAQTWIDAARAPDARTEPALALEVAESWLWRHGRPDVAATIAERVLALPDPLAPALREHALELAALGFGAAGAWPRVVALRTQALTADAPPERIAASAALLLDRGADAAGALEACWTALERLDAAGDALGWLRVLDVAIDAASQRGDLRRLELLDRRAELIAGLPGGALEALATRHAVAAEHTRAGEHADAAILWAELADDPATQLARAAGRIAWLASAWAAAAAQDRELALAAHRRLADAECAPVAATHAWRALELAAAAGLPTSDLARALGDAVGGPIAESWLDLVEVAAPTAATVARFEKRGGVAVRWAAVVAERLGDRARARTLWRRAAAEVSAQLGTEWDHIARLLRSADDTQVGSSHEDDRLDELSATYAAWAASELDPRTQALLESARGVVDVARGDFVEAEESLQRAAELDPRDPMCRAALAEVYRAGKRHEQLAGVLADLAATLVSREGRATAAREYADLLDEHLGDPAGARAALERMLVERPEDDEAMVGLAKLYERDGQAPRASELRKRAAAIAPVARRGELWLEIARSEEARGDRDGALAALDHAAEHTGQRTLALAAQTRLLRSSGRLDKALAIVRGELAEEPPLDRRLQLQTDHAQLLSELGQEPDAVVGAYLDILGVEPDHAAALAGIEAPARALGMWDELARAYRGARPSGHGLAVLAEALAKLGESAELADVRRKQLELAPTPAEKAQRGDELAQLYEHELGDVDAAIRALTAAQAALATEPRQRELLRLLRAAQRWPEVAAVLERELPTLRESDRAIQIELLLELGELRASRLARPNDAITAYEAVLELRADEPAAQGALERLYEQQGRERELAHMLELRADATAEPVARGVLFGRVAGLRATRGDIDGALAAYTAAFAADPTNRDVFTSMERVCYKAERWAAAMQLYETAIAHVEAGKSRAYRLGDLYARRGNVQLQFLGQVDAGIASYQKVVEVDSQPAAAVQKLEELCAKRNDWAPLISAWERRAETQRDSGRRIEALRNAAALSTDRAGDPRNSVRLQRKLLTLSPGDAQAASSLEKYYEDSDDNTGLIDVLKAKLLAAATPEDAVEILRKIARTSEEGARDVDTATEHYLKILEIQDTNRDALDALARIYESTEQWAEFIEVTRKLIKVTTDRNTKALLYFRCGSVMEAKFSREHDAIRYYDAAIKTSSACLPAVHGLRDLYRRREEWPRVIETLELEVKLWQDDKERAGVFAQIGRIYEQQLGDTERATNFYESALTVDPECVPANQALFEQMFERGEWTKAQPLAATLAQKAIRDGDPTTRSEFFRKRGIVARMTGDPKSAADSLIYALEIKPLNTQALDDLGLLARDAPDAWDFDATYRELDKVYRKRDDASALLARVHIGHAVILEREGDLDGATLLYADALALAPADFTVLSAIVDFHADMRRWGAAVAAIDRFVSETNAPPADRLAALMRLVMIHADGEMDAARATAVLADVIRFDPAHHDAHYALAQQCFLIGRYAEARAAIDRVIELATAPGQPLLPEALARYYYYKGRILDAAGDARAAAPQYRRAIEYDPGYAPPALVLARRASDAGDQRQAETLLIEAAHAAMAQGGPRAAVPLQRGLARMLLASGDRPAAIEAYRGILNVEPDGASDRVALAEIYAVDDPARAISELRKVLDRDIHHAPAYRLLAGYYSRTGDEERAYRVLTALDLLGFSEDADRDTITRLRQEREPVPLQHALADDPRDQLLVNASATEPLGEVFAALAEEISALVVPPSLGESLQPARAVGDDRLMAISSEVAALSEVEAEIFVGDKVPGLAAFTAYPRRMLVLDRTLLGESDAGLRFLFGMAFEAIRGGYATLLQLGARQRREMVQLLRGLVAADADRTGPAAELAAKASGRAGKVLERHAGLKDADAAAWLDGMAACAKRAGLLACDDFAAAILMVARLSGEQLPSHDAAVALGAVLGGPDLVRFYLSDPYQMLRDQLTS